MKRRAQAACSPTGGRKRRRRGAWALARAADVRRGAALRGARVARCRRRASPHRDCRRQSTPAPHPHHSVAATASHPTCAGRGRRAHSTGDCRGHHGRRKRGGGGGGSRGSVLRGFRRWLSSPTSLPLPPALLPPIALSPPCPPPKEPAPPPPRICGRRRRRCRRARRRRGGGGGSAGRLRGGCAPRPSCTRLLARQPAPPLPPVTVLLFRRCHRRRRHADGARGAQLGPRVPDAAAAGVRSWPRRCSWRRGGGALGNAQVGSAPPRPTLGECSADGGRGGGGGGQRRQVTAHAAIIGGGEVPAAARSAAPPPTTKVYPTPLDP